MYKKQHIHFMGIGGIGVSGIAEILRLQGYDVSGCDKYVDTKVVYHLKEIGCKIEQNHNKEHIEDVDILVCSSAVSKNDPEVLAASKKGIPVIARAEMLAELMKKKYGIAISGAHGKTTTTSMISHILIEAKIDPTIVIGGILKNISANAKLGKGKFLVAEADESDRSLLKLDPAIAVVTNIDMEHLDTYKDLDDIKNTFKSFLKKLPFFGKAFLCTQDQNVSSIIKELDVPYITYGFDNADIVGKVIDIEKASSCFEVFLKTDTLYFKQLFSDVLVDDKVDELFFLGKVDLNMPGKHNILNALAAIGVCLELAIPFEQIKKSLKTFSGIERRFEFKGSFKGTEIFDDYGHHPTEIKNTLEIAEKRAKRNLHVIFQPHRFTRTQKLWDDFVATFSKCKKIKTLYITDIYPASEQPISGVTSELLAKDIERLNKDIKVVYSPLYEDIEEKVQKIIEKDDLLLTIGAGKVDRIGENLLKKAV